MSLCYCFKRRWHVFKNIFYGYEEESFNYPQQHANIPWENSTEEQQGRHVHFSKEVTDEYKIYSENWCNYCVPKRQVYNAYGISFESKDEREAFESKMACMEKILEDELYEIRQQHIRLREEQSKLTHPKQRNSTKLTHVEAKISKDFARRDDFSKKRETMDDSEFIKTDENPLVEEVGVMNEVQDLLEQMCNFSKELKDIEKILNIEVRERLLHPEPRLIHIKAPEDELSEQMKNDGGFRYCSSDNSVRRISYDTLPPPLTLSELLTKQPQSDT